MGTNEGKALSEATEKLEAARAAVATANRAVSSLVARIGELAGEQEACEAALEAEVPAKVSQGELAERARTEARLRQIARELQDAEAALPAARANVDSAEGELRDVIRGHARAELAALDAAVRASDEQLTEHFRATEHELRTRLAAHQELLRQAGTMEHGLKRHDQSFADFTRRSFWAHAAGVVATRQPRLQVWESIGRVLDDVDSADRSRRDEASREQQTSRYVEKLLREGIAEGRLVRGPTAAGKP